MASITRVVDPTANYENDISIALTNINGTCSKTEEIHAEFLRVLRKIVSEGLATPEIKAREFNPLLELISGLKGTQSYLHDAFSETLKKVCTTSLKRFSASVKMPTPKSAWGLPTRPSVPTPILDPGLAWEGPKAAPIKKREPTELQSYISRNRDIFDLFFQRGIGLFDLPMFSFRFLQACVENKEEFCDIFARTKEGDWREIPIFEGVIKNFEANMQVYFNNRGLYKSLASSHIDAKDLLTIRTDFLSTISNRRSDLARFYARYPSYPLFGLECLEADLLDRVLSEPIKFKPLIGVGAKYLKKLSKRALRDLISNPDSEDNKAWIAQNQYIPKTTRKKPKGV